MRHLLIFIFCVLSLLQVAATSKIDSAEFAIQLSDKANQAYQAGNFQKAAEYYDQLIRSGLSNGHIHYNLANAYYRLGRIGRAIAEYRRAQLDIPRDPDVTANLRLARKNVVDRIEETNEHSFVVLSLSKLIPQLSKSEREKLFFLFYAFFWVSLVCWSFSRRPIFIHAAAIVFVCSIISFSWAALFHYGRQGDLIFGFSAFGRPAVITAGEVNVFSGDAETFQVVFVLHEGTEVLSETDRGDWLQIFLPGERRGWVKKDQVEIL